MPTPDELLGRLTAGRPGRLRHVEHLPGRTARYAEWPPSLPPALLAALVGSGVDRPWLHQRQVLDAAASGEHVVVATGTASGKSLAYQVPVLSALLDGLTAPTGRGATALYLSPTKALAADQLEHLDRLALPGLRIATYDGDTPAEERRWVRDHAHLVLTNPDLLHHSLLPGHRRWAGFLRGLRYVVVDECHTYRGVFGSHVSAVLRRLTRVAGHYGADPTFLLASATVRDPAVHASTLVGATVRAVVDDASPRGAMTFALWEPPTVDDSRRSATAETADLLADLVATGVQTVAFARSRAGVETVASRARERLGHVSPPGADQVAAYRGGYLPQERRHLERDLREGRLLGLAATNALELGVDVSGLDAVLLGGWPGRLASVWQQAGRAGRAGADSLAVLVAADDPLDTYVVHHPEVLFGAPVEATVIDPTNRQVLAPHLAAAAAELRLTEDDLALFGPGARDVVDVLTARSILRRRPGGWFWAREDRPADHVSLRGVGEVVAIVEERTGRVLGTVDEGSAHSQVHTGAVHVHQGETYVVTELDLAARVATVVRGDPGWSTVAQSTSSFTLGTPEQRSHHGEVTVGFGAVRVTGRVTGFVRRLPTGEVLGMHALDLPERTLDTRGVWWTMTPGLLAGAAIAEPDVPGALHAAEHAAIGLLPLLAACDRWDIGGVSTACHADTGLPTILVYDGYPGGAGFAERGHRDLARWLVATHDAVAGCACESGCPACVQSPKCGNGNEPLDKDGSLRLLDSVLRSLRG